jgi:hypothetical protein
MLVKSVNILIGPLYGSFVRRWEGDFGRGRHRHPKIPLYLYPIPLGGKTPQRRIPFRLYRLEDKPYLRQRRLLRP